MFYPFLPVAAVAACSTPAPVNAPNEFERSVLRDAARDIDWYQARAEWHRARNEPHSVESAAYYDRQAADAQEELDFLQKDIALRGRETPSEYLSRNRAHLAKRRAKLDRLESEKPHLKGALIPLRRALDEGDAKLVEYAKRHGVR